MTFAPSMPQRAGDSGQSLRRFLAFEVEDMAFSMLLDATARGRLDATPDETLDRTNFAVVVLSRGSEVLAYNKAESVLSGLEEKRVIGRPFFTSIAPCTNNVLIARRFETETVLDQLLDYVSPSKWP